MLTGSEHSERAAGQTGEWLLHLRAVSGGLSLGVHGAPADRIQTQGALHRHASHLATAGRQPQEPSLWNIHVSHLQNTYTRR